MGYPLPRGGGFLTARGALAVAAAACIPACSSAKDRGTGIWQVGCELATDRHLSNKGRGGEAVWSYTSGVIFYFEDTLVDVDIPFF